MILCALRHADNVVTVSRAQRIFPKIDGWISLKIDGWFWMLLRPKVAVDHVLLTSSRREFVRSAGPDNHYVNAFVNA
jgi:hypothetical protein